MLNLLKSSYLFIFIKFFYALIFQEKKFCIILNYHRVGPTNNNNPFHKLHCVTTRTLKSQIILCKLIGKFESLDNIVEGRLKSKLNFGLTFDDVSSSTQEILVWLQNKDIPFAICPCKSLTNDNIGWRDKVYFINQYVDEQKIYKKLSSVFSSDEFTGNLDFYSLSKSERFNSHKMINEVVAPLFDAIHPKELKKWARSNYFNLSELLQLKSTLKDLIFINHSSTHVSLTSLSPEEVKLEVEECPKILFELL